MNKGIKYLMVGAVAAGVALSSYGAVITVNVGTAGNTFLALAGGTYEPGSGATISLGTFASTPTDGSSSLAGFTTWASGGAISDGVITLGGFSTDESTFSHTQIYMTVQDGSQLGIFYVNMANLSTWRFPAGTDFPNDTSLDLQDLLANANGTSTALATGAHIVFGSSAVPGDGYNQIRLGETAAVPEPSSILLVAVGVLGMFGLMRRRS